MPSASTPGVGTIEPDTRETTTIREQLDAHRKSPVCANCHRMIDPPGFALESFDPIGGFRNTYRVSCGNDDIRRVHGPRALYRGDPGGRERCVTPEGDALVGIDEYKRHLASQLLVHATGTEIEFADRDSVEHILAELGDRGYPVRAMIQEVVTSDLFRRQ